MTTLQLLIVCVAVIAVVLIVVRADRRAREHDARKTDGAAADRKAARELADAVRALTAAAAAHDDAARKPVADLTSAIRALEASTAALTEQVGGRAPAPSRVGRRVTVHISHPAEHTLFGVVVGDYTDRLVLDDGELVLSTGTRPLPGRQSIEVAHIGWIDDLGVVSRVPDTAPQGA